MNCRPVRAASSPPSAAKGRCRLLDMGLTPRTRVTLQKRAPRGDPVEIRLRGYELTLRVEDAQSITVEVAQ